jgi:hypothetical protein
MALCRTGSDADLATRLYISTYYVVIEISRGKGIWYFFRSLLKFTVTYNITRALGFRSGTSAAGGGSTGPADCSPSYLADPPLD